MRILVDECAPQDDGYREVVGDEKLARADPGVRFHAQRDTARRGEPRAVGIRKLPRPLLETTCTLSNAPRC